MSGYYWKLTIRPAQKRYDPSQPRVPAGSSQGGQWTSSGTMTRGGEHPWVAIAREKFGTTEDWKEAGFILPDGSLLNIRDKENPYLSLPGVSRLQHYAVAGEVMGDDEARRGSGHLEPLWNFMKQTGMVRLYVSSFHPEVAVSTVAGTVPTSSQRERILQLTDDPKMEVTADIISMTGSTLSHGQLRNRLEAAAWFRRLRGWADVND